MNPTFFLSKYRVLCYLGFMAVWLPFFACSNTQMPKSNEAILVDTSVQGQDSIQSVSAKNRPAPKTLQLLDTKQLDTLSLQGNRIESVVVDEVTNITYHAFSNVHQERDEKGAYIYGTTTFESGIILPNGKRIVFSNKYDETVLSMHNNIISTQMFNIMGETEGYVELKRYRLDKGKLHLIARKRIEHPEIEFMPIKHNQNTLLCGQGVAGGFLFELYSPSLKLISTYVPFESGFEQAVYAQTDSTIVIAVNPSDTKKHSIKIAVLDAQTGKLISENEIQRNDFRVVQVYPFKNMAVVCGRPPKTGRCLLGVRYDGQILWEKLLNLPAYLQGVDIVANEELHTLYLYYNRAFERDWEDNLACLNMETGVFVWQNKISSFYPFYHNSSNTHTRAMALEHTNNNLVFFIGNMKEPLTHDNNDTYTQNNLYVFDANGNLTHSSDAVQDDNHFEVNIDKDKLIIYAKTQIYTYELPK